MICVFIGGEVESRLGMKQGQVAVPKQVDRADSAEFEFSDGDALHLAYLSFIPETVVIYVPQLEAGDTTRMLCCGTHMGLMY